MFRSTKLIVAGLSLASFAMIAPSITLADGPTSQPAEGAKPPRMQPGDRLDKALGDLKLTDDQKKQIDPIVAKFKDDVKAIMADKSIERDDKRTKVKDLVTSAVKDISAVLTDEQKAQLKKDMEEKRANGGGGKKGGGDKPTPPPAN